MLNTYLIFLISILCHRGFDKKIACPTTDATYHGKIEFTDAIPSGAYMSSVFKLHNDREIKALSNGTIAIKEVTKTPFGDTVFTVMITNNNYQYIYFLIEDLEVANHQKVLKGDVIGIIDKRDRFDLQILKNNMIVKSKFTCNQ